MAASVLFACKKEKVDNTPVATETPQVTNIQPKNPQPGDVVTVTGTGFGTTATDVKVTIGSKTVTISSVTATEIKFTVPADLTSGDLAVAIKDVKAAIKDPQGMAITVTPKPVTTPTFTAMSPTSGKTGDVITLTGTNFSTLASDNKVFFATNTGGTVVLGTIKTVTATQITVEVPASAITGGILIDVKGTNAVPAAGFSTTFTVTTTTGSGTNNVAYINSISGKLNFSKIATSTNEIAEMYYDKVKNYIYYSDYSLLNQTNNKLYKQDPTGNNPAVVFTADARITKVVKIATDAQGNVYTLQYIDSTPSNYDVYKISADGSTVTEIKKNFDISANSSSRYFFFVNAANEICIRPDFKITQSGEIISTKANALFGLQQFAGGAYYNSSTAYLVQDPNNTSIANKATFIKWNLADGTVADAGFTLKDLFNADDANQFSTNNNISKLKITADDSDNLYALMDHSYISGQITKTWMIRKAKAGSSASTLLGTFAIKFPSLDLTDYLGAVIFVSDARGNLYIKANQKDIIRISQ
ncbi:IPT/TIG domain-containing protein [Mucilaginibacter auburnensis]|uniref:IPT/TIG domain-containing protein n=1 Tax=Mucilaginibacter auburnensis TaxID=1457233 RepID=A0A2H9VP86_9SPHI|nr:IPT/TIG domain-containing protein [Mucilaginibacter auburnensis]PJJ80123.1 IPT/TIG domain-containing protein [Mucilaginibacter auburnensis]